MDHRLFVARQVVTKIALLIERLAHPGDIAVAEDAPDPGEELLLVAVALDPWLFSEGDQRLRHC